MKRKNKQLKNGKGITFIEAITNIYVCVLLISVCMTVSITYIKMRVTIRQKQQAIEELSLAMNEIGKIIRMSECDEIECVDPTNKILKINPNQGDLSSAWYRIEGDDLEINTGAGYMVMMDRIGGEFYITRDGLDEIPLITIELWKLDKQTPPQEINGTRVKTSVSMRSRYNE